MIGAVLTILLLVIGFSWDGMIYAVIVSNIVVGIYIYQLAKHEFPLRIFIQKKILTNFLKISIPLLPVFFFSWVILSSDSYFLLHYKGENFVGKYAVIYGLSSIILILRMTLNFFWFPLSSKLWIENRENYKRVFCMIFTTLSIGLLMVVLIFELNSKVFMQIFARSIEYRDSYVIMGTIALALGMMVLITLLTGPLYSNKNTSSISVSYLVGAILNCALNFLLVPPYGIWGAAISTAVSYLLIILAMAYFNYNIAKFSFFDKRLIYVLIFFMPVWFIISIIRERVDILQLLIVNVAMVSSLGTLIYFKILRKEEKEYFASILNEFRLKKNIKHHQ
jgi:O-antigen/teichoic acid export membrane protein